MPEIDRDKPLPSHTKLNYYECYAKIVLENLFPSFFSELLLKDKPDLQDIQNQIGIEVTIAETSETMEAQRLYSTLHNVDTATQSRNIECMKQCGATCKDGILFGPNGSDDFTLVNHTIDAKAEKLQKGRYDKFDEYHLFIFSSIFAFEPMLKDEINYLERRRIADYFKKIYIAIPGKLLCFDLIKNIDEVFDIDIYRQFDWAKRACQMVEDGEKSG